MAALTCWWVRPRRQRPLGTGLRPSPPHTQRPSFWALEGERGKGWHRVVRTVPETPPQRYHSGLRQAPPHTHIPPLLKLHTRILRTKSKCLIRTSGVTWPFLLSRALLLIPQSSAQCHLLTEACLDHHPNRPISSSTLFFFKLIFYWSTIDIQKAIPIYFLYTSWWVW